MNLRDPSTRAGFEPMKKFICSNIQNLLEDFTPQKYPQDYLHILGYDNESRFDPKISKRKGDHARGFGNRDLSIIRYRNEMDSRILLLTGQLKSNNKKTTKTEAKQQYNKGLYNLLPSNKVPPQRAKKMLGILPDPPKLTLNHIAGMVAMGSTFVPEMVTPAAAIDPPMNMTF